jgi:murein DD-endopeptidase MepM/ murein hydrolase activator NlpD
MIKLSISLPAKHRIDIKFVKNRQVWNIKPFFPPLADVLRAKKGSVISRYFRILFENKKIKKVLGTNLALLVFTASFVKTPINIYAGEVASKEYSQPVILSTDKVVQFPVSNVSITQNFGLFHPGIDFDGLTGDKIRPFKKGVVKRIENSKFGYGKAVIIDHRDNTESLYAHLSKILVKEGDTVTFDTNIGEMGATGRASGDHLHFEIHDHGIPVNPRLSLPF